MGLMNGVNTNKKTDDGLRETSKSQSRGKGAALGVDVAVVKSKDGPADHALDVLMTTERFRNLKVHKNQLTIQ